MLHASFLLSCEGNFIFQAERADLCPIWLTSYYSTCNLFYKFYLHYLIFAGGSDCIHGSDWLRCTSKGGRHWSGRWDFHPHAEQRVCVCGTQHLHDRPEPGTYTSFAVCTACVFVCGGLEIKDINFQNYCPPAPLPLSTCQDIFLKLLPTTISHTHTHTIQQYLSCFNCMCLYSPDGPGSQQQYWQLISSHR